MSRYLVTVAAGFMGSHLTEALLARGDDVVAVDLVHRLLRPVAERGERSRVRGRARLDVAEDDLPLDGVDGVFHLAAQPVSARASSSPDVYLHRNVLATQRVFEQSSCARRLRVVVVDLRRRGGVPDVRVRAPEADLPLRHHEARVRAPRATHTARDAASACATSPSTDRGSDPTWRSRDSSTRRSRAASSSSTATRRARSRTSPTRWPRRWPRWIAARAARSTTSAAARRLRCAKRSACSSTSADAELDVRAEPAARGDAKRTAADVSLIAREPGRAPTTKLEDGLAAQWAWAVDRVAAR